MNEINLKLETKHINCETRVIKTALIYEYGEPEIVIPKNIIKKSEKNLFKELKQYLKNIL
jgi:hypothetical protein